MVQSVKKEFLNDRLILTVNSTNAITDVIKAACDNDPWLAYVGKMENGDKCLELISYDGKTYESSFSRVDKVLSCYIYTVELKPPLCT